MNGIGRIAAIGMSLALLASCATPASREGTAITERAPGKPIAGTVSVETRGGAETDGLASANIADADFKAAIESSIVKSSLFKSVVPGKGGDYELSVVVSQLSKPLFGANFKVDMETGWSLVKAADKSVVMRKVIKSSHTATMGDAFAGVTRLRLAVEGAARNNISLGLQAIAELGLR